jgi:tripartite-type tricarboxylate transporter receptor subunit TctC
MSRSPRSLLASSRRQWLAASVALVTSLFTAGASADTRQVRLLVGFPAGGGTDAIARLLSEPLKEQLGMPVIVENRPGAGGQLAAQALKTATPDGHTLFLTHDHTISIIPQVVKNPGFDPDKDFVPVAGFATFVNGLAVSGGTPATDFKSYVDWLRKSGGKSAVGVPAPGSVPEFLVQVLAQKNKVDLVALPYKGSAPMMADMYGNQIPAGVASMPEFIEPHKAGKLRVLGVMGKTRQPLLPEVPTFTELGIPGFEDVPYYGLFAPAGTPKAMIDQVSAAMAKVIAQPAIKERLSALGLNVGYMTPEQLGRREHAYTQTWARIIRESGFQPQ